MVTRARKCLKITAVWFACVVAAIGLAEGAYGQAAAPKITDIVVVGNKNLNRESIVASSGLKVGDALTQAALDDAKRRLLSTQNFGANNADNPDDAVKITGVIDGANAKVTIEVDENDLVKGINISGTGPMLAKAIRDLLLTKEGFVLNLGTLRRDADRISEHYKAKGFQATVSSDIAMPNGILEIPIVVAKVNEVKITGLKKTKKMVVLRTMTQVKGAYFNTDALQKDLYRVFNTGLFADVSPAIVPRSPGLVDINLNMEEKHTGTVSVFLGYSSRNSLVGGAEVGENNLMGRGQSVSLRWDTGGIASRNSLDLGFSEPWLDNKHTSLSVNGYDKTVYRFSKSVGTGTGGTGSDSDYYEVHTGGQISLSRPFRGDAYRGTLGLRYDHVRMPSIAVTQGDAAALQNGPIMAVTMRASHNTRDLDQDPAAGGYEVLSLDIGRADLKPVETSGEQTATGVFGVVNFQKLQLDARRYWSPKGKRKAPKERMTTLAFRLSGGMTVGTPPYFEQYFVGGAESLRGYNEDRFWGKNMLLASMELRHPLAQALTGVVFCDAGDAWSGPYDKVQFAGFDQHKGFSPSIGFGLGLRVVTPIGPIRIDQGFGREGARTHFSIGHVF